MAHDIEADKSSKHFVSRDATLKNREYTSEQLSLVKKIRACKDYYEILSINKNASVREIRNSYRKIALKLHPDKNGAPGAEEAFKTAVNAVTVLTDIRKRINYDLYKNGTDCERSTKSNRPRSYTGGFDDAEVNTDKYFNPGYGLRSRVYTRRGQQWQRKTDDIKQQQHSHIKENQNTGLLTIAEVLVSILMVILLAMMFGYYFISDLSYNLSTSDYFRI
ncbi:dnaJ homolog subfamily B member 1-like isoform X2 [Euwallacea fornicatus]|uniref:dnaJ homolog subfamily B member 1-like isoform X2 n=1 Tax=Euwallacea fornicatus TaxID=995702 RepID=UPI00338E0752